ncbi:MAG: Hsp33 family molecular chaperone HslO, partial [Lentisphaeraceae bacterium]|nr:Hsp33 family molecular chaperone HslO [Lentisphaeraceae bacterium]
GASENDYSHLQQLTATIKDNELFELEPNDILNRLYHQEEVRIFEPQSLSYVCGCSRERSEGALASLYASLAGAPRAESPAPRVAAGGSQLGFQYDLEHPIESLATGTLLSVRAAMDPRISATQIPCDTGTQSVDEWRSFAAIAWATAYTRFTLLTGDGKEKKDFTPLLKGVDEKLRNPMALVFGELQKDLQALNGKWTADDSEKSFNYNYFRAIPEELHTGPGY